MTYDKKHIASSYEALNKMAKGGNTEKLIDVLPGNTQELVDQGLVTYRGCGIDGKYAGLFKLKIEGKEYLVTLEKLRSLKRDGQKIPFDAPFRKHHESGGNLSRDRKFQSQEPWEQNYDRKTSPKHPHYNTMAGGGGLRPGEGYGIKTGKEIWDQEWNYDQREHFLKDHYQNNEAGNPMELRSKNYDELPSRVQTAIGIHKVMGRYKTGGQVNEKTYGGKSGKEVWNNVWDQDQRKHFLEDHFSGIDLSEEAKNDFYNLPMDIQIAVDIHTEIKGKYETGGELPGENMDVYKYTTQYFVVAPEVAQAFKEAMEKVDDDKDEGSAFYEARKQHMMDFAMQVDKILKLEYDAIVNGKELTDTDLNNMVDHMAQAGIFNHKAGDVVNLQGTLGPHINKISTIKNGTYAPETNQDEWLEKYEMEQGGSIPVISVDDNVVIKEEFLTVSKLWPDTKPFRKLFLDIYQNINNAGKVLSTSIGTATVQFGKNTVKMPKKLLQKLDFKRGGTIDTDTPIIPEIIADQVSRNVLMDKADKPGPQDIETLPQRLKSLSDHLVNKANELYKSSPFFKKKMNQEGNAGRDGLYQFMHHWAMAYVNKNHFKAGGITTTGHHAQRDTLESYLAKIGLPRITDLGISKQEYDYISAKKAIEEVPQLNTAWKKAVVKSVDGFLSRSFSRDQMIEYVRKNITSRPQIWVQLKKDRGLLFLDPNSVPAAYQDWLAKLLVSGIYGEFELDNSAWNRYLPESLKAEISQVSVERGKAKLASMLESSQAGHGRYEMGGSLDMILGNPNYPHDFRFDIHGPLFGKGGKTEKTNFLTEYEKRSVENQFLQLCKSNNYAGVYDFEPGKLTLQWGKYGYSVSEDQQENDYTKIAEAAKLFREKYGDRYLAFASMSDKYNIVIIADYKAISENDNLYEKITSNKKIYSQIKKAGYKNERIDKKVRETEARIKFVKSAIKQFKEKYGYELSEHEVKHFTDIYPHLSPRGFKVRFDDQRMSEGTVFADADKMFDYLMSNEFYNAFKIQGRGISHASIDFDTYGIDFKWYKNAGIEFNFIFGPFVEKNITADNLKQAIEDIVKKYKAGYDYFIAKKIMKNGGVVSAKADEVKKLIFKHLEKLEETQEKKQNVVTEARIQRLLDADYTSQEILEIFIGYQCVHQIEISGEYGDTSYGGAEGLFTLMLDYVDNIIDELVSAASKNEYEIGLKYPEFDWSDIIKKYNINLEAKIIKGPVKQFDTDGTRQYEYQVFTGDNIVIGAISDYIKIKNGVREKDNYSKRDIVTDGEFNDGYWGIVSSKKEVINDIVSMIVKKKDGYIKDMDIYVNRTGGVDAGDLKTAAIKFQEGGVTEKEDIGQYSLVPLPTYKYQYVLKSWLDDHNKKNLTYKLAVLLLLRVKDPDVILNIDIDDPKAYNQYSRLLRRLDSIDGNSKHEMAWRTDNYSMWEAEGWARESLEEKFTLQKNHESGGSVSAEYGVAETIRDQIGHKAFYMLGAYNLVKDTKENSLSFRIRGSKKANYIKITLEPNDTYTMEFGTIRKPAIGKALQMTAEQYMKAMYKQGDIVKGLHAEDLHSTIEAHTGLYTRLFEKGGQVNLGENGLLHALLQTISSGTIANMTGVSAYKKIDGIRTTAIQMLLRDGDQPYSLDNLKKLLGESVDEWRENEAEYSFLKNHYEYGGTISDSEKSILQKYGFTIKEFAELLNSKFPDSFRFKVYKLKNRQSQKIDFDYDNEIKDQKMKFLFPGRKTSRGLEYQVFQGQENTYFHFIITDKDENDEYGGSFGFKDEGDVPTEYITMFIAFLQEAYGYPFTVKQVVMADGGQLTTYTGYAKGGRLSVEDWLEKQADSIVKHYLGDSTEDNQVNQQSELRHKGDYVIDKEHSGKFAGTFIEICFGDTYMSSLQKINNDYETFIEYVNGLGLSKSLSVDATTDDNAKSFNFMFTKISDLYKKSGRYDDGGQVDPITAAKSNARNMLDSNEESYNMVVQEAKRYVGNSYWDLLTTAEKQEIISEIKEHWFDGMTYNKGGMIDHPKYEYKTLPLLFNVGDQFRVHGWIMLKGVDEGDYEVVESGDYAVKFIKLLKDGSKSKKHPLHFSKSSLLGSLNTYLSGDINGIQLLKSSNYPIIKKDELAKGGRVKFADKVKAISSSLKGKTVPKKYQKEYGKKYSNSEAVKAARRITGAMVKKEKKSAKNPQ